ncbi:hypothetical protein [Streptomyces sp. UNOB3_S3]|uniref:hypothetical protein n=1 Tax=Streptomyces sp. UNOB3_S3 TaxID=2871682 RepID=UPI001E58F222|nr:hypothetical protein [Streptomyces sp. UNOB3_S3]MCC3775882.1 hypothetical protein [Streptomyces sp. UNOB3_S3]
MTTSPTLLASLVTCLLEDEPPQETPRHRRLVDTILEIQQLDQQILDSVDTTPTSVGPFGDLVDFTHLLLARMLAGDELRQLLFSPCCCPAPATAKGAPADADAPHLSWPEPPENIAHARLKVFAPLALAGAVHLYLLVQHRPAQMERHEEPSHTAPITASRAATARESVPVSDVAADATDQVTQPQKRSAGRPGPQPSTTLEQAIEIGRTAPLGRGGRASRRHIEKAIRDQGLRIGRDRLDKTKDFLQDELDRARADAA